LAKAKQRNQQHVIDAEGVQLLRTQLPSHWVVREYRPDYGLDFSVEVFRTLPSANGRQRLYETLGEHFFVQLKTTASPLSPKTIQLYARYNVEKRSEKLDKTWPWGSLQVVAQRLATSELVTVEKMGVGVPVLLVLAELRTGRCYFVCLNDYVDKILRPRFGNYASQASRTVHLPTRNQLGDPRIGGSALRWYAKRPKLYAAFQRFIFQYDSIREEIEDEAIDPLRMARYFAMRDLHFDFWDDTEMWPAISRYGAALRHFLDTGEAWNLRLDAKAAHISLLKRRKLDVASRCEHVVWLWKLLSRLAGHYEDECREWFLPTAMGYKGCYSGRKYVDTLEHNLSNFRYPQRGGATRTQR
jgi:hypothetical protein